MDVGIPEFFIVLVIVLLIFGPNRIASLGRELGKTIRNFREGLRELDEDDDSFQEERPKRSEETPGNE